jgi:branched-chain amino acid transport system permease protein
MEQQALNGIALGSIYALTAVAYSMVYGIVRLINFAFGEMFMAGAYLGAFFLGAGLSIFGTTYTGPNLGPFLAPIVAMALVGLLGWGVERIAYRPLRHAPPIASLITTLAVSMFLQGAGFFIFGFQQYPFPRGAFAGKTPLYWGSLVVDPTQVVIFVAAVVLAAGMMWMLRRTLFGIETRACAQDIRAAELQGVNSNRVIVSTFVIGSMFAALAGILWAALFNYLYPTMGFQAGLDGLVGAVLGGIGSVPGALLGGLVLGLVQSLAVAYLPGAGTFGDGIPFLVLIILLWGKPEGLLGNPAIARPGSIERPVPVFPNRRVRALFKS